MSVDYYAKSIIGVKIDNPRSIRQVRGCHHAENKSKFCSECGKPTYKEETGLHPVVESLESGLEPDGYQIIWSTDDNEAFVGFYKGDTDNSNKVTLPDDININKMKNGLRLILKDLYKEETFGLWTVLCNY